jgi:hypothetical protein
LTAILQRIDGLVRGDSAPQGGDLMPTKIQFIAYEIDTHDTTKIDSILSAKGAPRAR